jgi:predicted membrane channel-forming protein YqfA (hemolysin III family)
MFWPNLWFASASVWGSDAATWKIIYITTASIISLTSLIMTMMPIFQRNGYHVLRVATFGLNGLLGIATLLHISIACSDERVKTAEYMAIGSILIHGLGASFYALRVPERLGAVGQSHIFDYIQGHTIFHIFTIIAFILYNESMMRLWNLKP